MRGAWASFTSVHSSQVTKSRIVPTNAVSWHTSILRSRLLKTPTLSDKSSFLSEQQDEKRPAGKVTNIVDTLLDNMCDDILTNLPKDRRQELISKLSEERAVHSGGDLVENYCRVFIRLARKVNLPLRAFLEDKMDG